MTFQPCWDGIERSDATAMQAYLRELLFLARDALLARIDFLLSRPDIMKRLESLTVVLWRDEEFESTGWQISDPPLAEVFDRIADQVHQIVKRTLNLKTLFLSNMLITDELKSGILSLKRLCSLDILSCRVSDSTVQDEPMSSAPNLMVRPRNGMHQTAWSLLPSLTSLRWLCLLGGDTSSTILPPEDILQVRNPFVTLERVIITKVPPDEWLDLIDMIRSASAATGGRIPLTKLKLTFELGLSSFVLDQLLFALAGAPLEYLVIDGIRDGSPEIFQRIAGLFPDLQALTLSYRDSDRQQRNVGTVWPSPTWEYATSLSRFSRLKYLGWNFDAGLSFPPLVMMFFEDGYPEDWWATPDEEFKPSFEVARLLAVHCPTLEYTAFLTNGLPSHTHRIKRTDIGGCVVEEQLGLFDDSCLAFDPNVPLNLWPRFVRKENTD